MTSSFSVIVPARLNSSRLPGKLLLPLGGKAMLVHVIERALMSDAVRVIVAVDDARLADAVTETDATTVMTSTNHESGTDRIFEAIQDLGLDANDIIVNLQGDEPLMPPSVINQVAQILRDRPSCGIATLCAAIESPPEIFDPNVVKVIRNAESHAVYFSRAPIPWDREIFQGGEPQVVDRNWFRHIGIYAYRVWALQKFDTWIPSSLEKVERLEQLRFLENGLDIVIDEVTVPVPSGVDTARDLARVRAQLSESVD